MDNSNMDTKVISKKALAYRTPKLHKYGAMTVLTAAGTGTAAEAGSSSTNKQKP